LAKAQYPIDGKLGKDFKVTSPMGMRIHPVTHDKKHHNGTDIWSPHEPCWIEAPYDGKVLEAKKSTAPGGGFGNYVKMLHKIDGKWYTTIYAHMLDGSLKVTAGQTIEAGTPLGKMGSTGMSTGKHLHWELQEGKTYAWNPTGKGFIEPIGFFKALIALEKSKASAAVEATDDDPVAPAPTHDEAQARKVEEELAKKKAAAQAATGSATASASSPSKAKTYKVKAGDTLTKIAASNKTTVAALAKLNAIKDVNKLNVGQVIKLP
jgi:murein DD-endopeptidase MepM/ murein hydrolase activator NlpD